jgi:hypothetical protein
MEISNREIKQEIPYESEPKKPSFIQQMNLFKKSYNIQFTVLIMWIISSIMVIYYIIYQDAYMDLIRREILPADLSWMLYAALTMVLIGFGLLFIKDDPLVIERNELIASIKDVIKDNINLLFDYKFSEITDNLTPLVEKLTHHKLDKELTKIKDLQKKNEVNKDVKAALDNLGKIAEAGRTGELLESVSQFEKFMNANHSLILTILLTKFVDLRNRAMVGSNNPYGNHPNMGI